MAQLMSTSNPALNEQVFRGAGAAFGETMTCKGRSIRPESSFFVQSLPPRGHGTFSSIHIPLRLSALLRLWELSAG
jgi:hypothetical protein